MSLRLIKLVVHLANYTTLASKNKAKKALTNNNLTSNKTSLYITNTMIN